MLSLLLAVVVAGEPDYDLAAKAARLRGKESLERFAEMLSKELGETTKASIDIRDELESAHDPRLTAKEILRQKTKLRESLVPLRNELIAAGWAVSAIDSGKIIPILDLFQLKDGGIGTLSKGVAEVAQVIDASTAILRPPGDSGDRDFWVEGLNTEGFVDGRSIELNLPVSGSAKGCILFFKGSKTYPTVSGGNRTIRQASIVQLSSLNEKLKPDIAARVDADSIKRVKDLVEWVKSEAPEIKLQLTAQLEAERERQAEEFRAFEAQVNAEFRKWESKDGKFAVEARLMTASGKSVTLEKREPEGKTIKVERAVLSDADNEFAEKFNKAEKERLAKRAKK
jgi:hypothetical protein